MWSEQENSDALTGQVYEGYQVLSVLGTGSFGKVYKVLQHKTGVTFAMKHVLQNKKYKNRQLDILGQVESPYVVKLYKHFYKEEKTGLFLNLIMEYLPKVLNRQIKNYLFSKEFMSNDTVKKYLKCLLVALKDLHRNHICHRDIKTSNILIDDNQAKLCDFGSAKILKNNEKNIAYICSRYYRAPQLLLGAVYYSQQVDMWSLGCVAAQMMTNLVLFDGGNSTSMLSKIIRCIGAPTVDDMKAMQVDSQELIHVQGHGIRNRILKTNPDASIQLIELVQKMIVHNPLKRLTAAEALALPLFN